MSARGTRNTIDPGAQTQRQGDARPARSELYAKASPVMSAFE
jgi:hypothetical protein